MMSDGAHRCIERQVKQYGENINIMWLDTIAENAGLKGKCNNQPIGTTAVEIKTSKQLNPNLRWGSHR
jgi:hypothetical protein